jgi:DNA-binding transcriptional MerR regulator
MQIGKLAKTAGVSVQTVRFYERQGLLPDPGRTDSGYRRYTDAQVRQLRFIRQAKALGFSLEEIREILRTRGRGQCPCGKVISLAERHLQNVEGQIRHLETFRRELSKALKQWKPSGARQVSADAFCVLIERTMGVVNR